MKPLLPILAIAVLPGCGMLDRMARPDALPPGDTLRVSPGMMDDKPDECYEILAGYFPTGDYNQDGSVDGSDVEAFVCDWADCNRVDVDGNGCVEVDPDGDGWCDICDLKMWFRFWEAGI